MTEMKNLLDPEVVERMKALAAESKAPEVPVEAPEALPTRRSQVSLDAESEARIDVACIDCTTPMQVDPWKEGDPDAVFACVACAKVRCYGKKVTVIRRPKTKRRAWRTEDTPAERNRAEADRTKTKETDVTVNLDSLTDAKTGALIKEGIRMKMAEELPAKVAKAKKVKAKKERKDKALFVEAREARVAAKPLPGFTVGDLVVEALDLSEVTDVNEVVTAKVRSPYNKAIYRLKAGDLLDSETATYAVLAMTHMRLAELAAQQPKVEAKKKKAKAPAKAGKAEPKVEPKKDERPKVVAAIDPDAKAKRKALVKALVDAGTHTKDEAKAFAKSYL